MFSNDTSEKFSLIGASHLLFKKKDKQLVMVQMMIWWVKWFCMTIKCQLFYIYWFSFISNKICKFFDIHISFLIDFLLFYKICHFLKNFIYLFCIYIQRFSWNCHQLHDESWMRTNLNHLSLKIQHDNKNPHDTIFHSSNTLRHWVPCFTIFTCCIFLGIFLFDSDLISHHF